MALQGGASYTFQVWVNGSRGSAVATTIVRTNVPPTPGSCSTSPTEGEALSTVFTVRAESWTDVEDDEPLTFGFLYAVVGSGRAAVSVVERSSKDSASLSLPSGIAETDWEVEV